MHTLHSTHGTHGTHGLPYTHLPIITTTPPTTATSSTLHSMPPAVLVMIFVPLVLRQAGRPSRYLISNEWGWDFGFIPVVRDFLLEDNDCLLLHADRDVQVGLDSRTYVPICGNNRAEREALFRIPILGATTCNNWHPLVDASVRIFLLLKSYEEQWMNKWMKNWMLFLHSSKWMDATRTQCAI